MVLGKKCGSRASEGYGVGLVRSSSFRRKRVFLSKANKERGGGAGCVTPSKRQRIDQGSSFVSEDISSLENLPQEVLTKILCGVEHEDLKRLFFVSTAVREATLVAKQFHFAYSTPKKTVGFKDEGFLGGNFDDVEAPNAPKQSRVPRQRLCAKKLADISVALFASDKDDRKGCWPKRELFG